jgi:hypothetical protein
MHKTIAAISGMVILGGVAQGCTIQQGNASAFRDPIPQQGDAALAVAGTQAGGGTQTQALSGVHFQDMGSGGTADAGFYEFTRQTADGVDNLTFSLLAEIDAITSYPPSTLNGTEAEWGPGGDALDPVQWLLKVTLVGTNEYSYEVDGRPHGSSSNTAWQAIVTGHGYGKASPSYRSGSLSIDGDTLKALDPTRSNGGKVTINYDARTWPKTVVADVTTSDSSGEWYDVSVSHAADGSGQLTMTALSDISTPPDGTNESVDENSRWNSSGAGRDDVKMSGGDFGSTTVLATQCWSSTFAQTYYTDSVGYQPTAGDASSCVFDQASFDQ